jgi:hypothetical protein
MSSCDWENAAQAFQTERDTNIYVISSKILMALVVFIDAARTLRLLLMTSKSPFALVLIGFTFLFVATLLVTIWYGFLVTKLGMFFYYQGAL